MVLIQVSKPNCCSIHSTERGKCQDKILILTSISAFMSLGVCVCMFGYICVSTCLLICMYVCVYLIILHEHLVLKPHMYISVALTLDDSVLTSQKTKVVTSGSKPTLGFYTPTDDHSRSPRALRLVMIT